MGYKAIKESRGGENINYGISKDNNINNCQNGSGKPRKFSRSRMTKWTAPLNSSREI